MQTFFRFWMRTQRTRVAVTLALLFAAGALTIYTAVARPVSAGLLLWVFLSVIFSTACAIWSIRYLLNPPRASLARAATDRRLGAAWRALRGHSVAYRVDTTGGGLVINGGTRALVADCTFTTPLTD